MWFSKLSATGWYAGKINQSINHITTKMKTPSEYISVLEPYILVNKPISCIGRLLIYDYEIIYEINFWKWRFFLVLPIMYEF